MNNNFKPKPGYENIGGHNIASFGAPQQVNKGLDSHPGAARGFTNDLVAQGNANIQKRRASGQQGVNLGLANAQVSNITAPITQSRINGIQSFSNLKPQGQSTIPAAYNTTPVPSNEQVVGEFNDINANVAATLKQKQDSVQQQQLQLPGQGASIHQSQPGSGINAQDLTAYQRMRNKSKVTSGENAIEFQNFGRGLGAFFKGEMNPFEDN